MITLTSFEEWMDEEEAGQEGLIAVTGGWREGPLAAVLRGGISAQAVLELLTGSGIRDLTIIHPGGDGRKEYR